MAFTPSTSPSPRKPAFDLWMLAALSFVPIALLTFFSSHCPNVVRFVMLAFVAGVALHCFMRWRQGRVIAYAGFTGAWLLPVLSMLVFIAEFTPLGPGSGAEFFCMAVGMAIYGLLCGFVVAKLFEFTLVVVSFIRGRGASGEVGRREPLGSALERLDAMTTPLAYPPPYGLPRQFGIRGLLNFTTLAALILGVLRVFRSGEAAYSVVMVFVSGTLAAQILLFQGRKPVKASMWAGAFLLPLEVLATVLYHGVDHYFVRTLDELIFACAMGLSYLVPGGIAAGCVVGAVGGGLFYLLDEFLVWLFRGVPKPMLEPIADADADVLMGWIYGPKLCRRWAGERFTWPLDRERIIAHFAAAREDDAREIFKAVDARSGNMFGYVEVSIAGEFRRARLELAIVDTGASERGRLSLLLLSTIARYGFQHGKLASLSIVSDAREPEVAACFDRVCQTCSEIHSIRSEANETEASREW